MSLQLDIHKKFKGFSLDIGFETSGGCSGILGASGCGKSMTLKCIAGVERPDSGKIVLNGRVLFDSDKGINLTPQQRKVGYLFQNYALFPNMTVRENIGIGLKLLQKDKKLKVAEMVRLFHLEGLEENYPVQLSGGQQQRVALARILAYEPDVLMLDEPFSALDTHLREQLQLQLHKVLNSYKRDVMLVTHNRDEVYRFCSRVILMDAGRIVNTGDTKTVFRRPDNVTSAKLSGCKNISRAEKVSDFKVAALDWGITFQTSAPVTGDIRYVGIRAHDFKPADKGTIDRENTFALRLVDKSEGPFELNIILCNCHKKDISSENTIWWKVNREEWKKRLKGKVPEYFRVEPEDVMLLRA